MNFSSDMRRIRTFILTRAKFGFRWKKLPRDRDREREREREMSTGKFVGEVKNTLKLDSKRFWGIYRRERAQDSRVITIMYKINQFAIV